VQDWHASKPTQAFAAPWKDTPYRAVGARVIKPIPVSISLDVSGVLHDLRSALDHAGFACARASGVADPRKTHFPFARNKADFEKLRTKTCKDIPEPVLTYMFECKAYEEAGGNRLLYTLAALRNINEHRYIALCGQAISEATSSVSYDLKAIQSNHPDGLTDCMFEPRYFLRPEWSEESQELIFMVFDPRLGSTPEISVTTYLGFGEGTLAHGSEVVSFLAAMLKEVEQILRKILDLAETSGLFAKNGSIALRDPVGQ
jgi:hypothetical protein